MFFCYEFKFSFGVKIYTFNKIYFLIDDIATIEIEVIRLVVQRRHLKWSLKNCRDLIKKYFISQEDPEDSDKELAVINIEPPPPRAFVILDSIPLHRRQLTSRQSVSFFDVLLLRLHPQHDIT